MKLLFYFTVSVFVLSGCYLSDDQASDCTGSNQLPVTKQKQNEDVKQLIVREEVSLFNGKSLTNWKVSQFGGEGEVIVEKGTVEFDFGNPMTGITWNGTELPKLNYEISLEAVKLEGNDFFVGLTLPYKDSYFTLILGGWGGAVCGISSFDYMDASENETSFIENFKNNQWYKVSVQVKDDNIVVTLDGKKVIDARIDERKVHIRPEVDSSKPLGICSFETRAAYKNIRLKKLN